MPLIRVIDFETTGLKPPEAAICEIGWTDILLDTDLAGQTDWTINGPQSMYVNPGHPIPPEARGIHHICDRTVADSSPPSTGLQLLTQGSPEVFAAHNAPYDRQFFGGGDTPWICTRKVAMRLWPDAPNHQNQTLRYWLDIDGQYHFMPDRAQPSHRAGPDTYVTAHLILKALEATTISQMVEWTNQPSLLPGAIQFGKHRGTPWSKVVPSYLDWIVKQNDMDADVKFTARHWLNRRRSDDR
jgi:exodeoxyribonuclease X